jgi:hypothetical protein
MVSCDRLVVTPSVPRPPVAYSGMTAAPAPARGLTLETTVSCAGACMRGGPWGGSADSGGARTHGRRQDRDGQEEDDAEGAGAVEDERVQARRVHQLRVRHAEHRHQPRPGTRAGPAAARARRAGAPARARSWRASGSEHAERGAAGRVGCRSGQAAAPEDVQAVEAERRRLDEEVGQVLRGGGSVSSRRAQAAPSTPGQGAAQRTSRH